MPEPREDKLVGRVLGGYRVLEPLGRGGIGHLYRAAAVDGPGTVALRVLPPALASDREARTRFLREVQVLRSLRHPGLVELRDYALEGEVPWYAVELVAGEPLARLIGPGRRRWTPAEVHRLAREVLDALAALHKARVVHRGLSPASLMHDGRGRFRIVDFGLVYAAGWRHVTEKGEGLGKAPWQAPEILAGAEAGPGADLFSLGSVLYEAATGTRMWGEAGPVDLSLGRPGSRPPPLAAVMPGFDPGLSAFVETLSGDRPGTRFPDAAAALAALPSPPLPVRAPAPARPAPAVPGHPAPGRARLAGWLALAALAAAGAWLWRDRGEAAYQVTATQGAGGLVLAWKTGLRTPTVVRLVHQASGESLRYRAGPEPTRSHSLRLPLEPEVEYRWAILGSGDRELASGSAQRPAGAFEPSGLESGWSRDGGFAVRFRTGAEALARLRGTGPAGPAEVREAAPATVHALALPPLPPDRGYAGVTLELEAPDGSGGRIELDPEPFRPPLDRLREFLEGSARGTLGVLPRLLAAGELRVGRAGPYQEALAEDGFEARWKTHRELASALLADSRLDLLGVRMPLYRRLTRLEDLDSLLIYMGEAPRFGIRDAYAGLVAALEEPAGVPPGAQRLGGEDRPVAMLPPAVTTAYSRVVFALSSALTYPERELAFEVDPARLAAATRARLYLVAGSLHEGLVLEARLGPEAVLAFRGDGRRRALARAETQVESSALEGARYPRLVTGLAFPKELLAPGPNRLVLRARPLHGIPLTEVTIVESAWLLLD